MYIYWALNDTIAIESTTLDLSTLPSTTHMYNKLLTKVISLLFIVYAASVNTFYNQEELSNLWDRTNPKD